MAKRKRELLLQSGTNEKQRWSIRKLSIGVVSVFIGTSLFFLMNSNTRVYADSINNGLSGQTIIQDSTSNSSDQAVSEQKSASPANQDTKAEAQTATANDAQADVEKQEPAAQSQQTAPQAQVSAPASVKEQASPATGNQEAKAENKQAQEDDSAKAEAQTATANDAQADVEKQEPAAQSQQTAPQAQVSAPASVKEQASTAEGQTNDSANADAAIDATTEEKKDSANNSSDAATEDGKNESTTLDVSQALKTSTVAADNKKMVTASLANTADSISENNADTTAVPGFSVTDPEYPSEMYRDPNPEHYTFFWVGQTGNGYQTVISTNRNGDGQIHVFELDQNNNVINSFDLDKNKRHTSWQTGVRVIYYNDEYAGLVSVGSSGGLITKYEVSGGNSDRPYNSISFIVPRLNTQVTSYHDKDGNDITDKNGKKIESVVQQGLDGQKYTTTGTKVIDGYYAKAPSNAQGTMSPYGKIGSKYELNYHNGYIAEYTQTDDAGDMSVQMYYEDQYGNRFLATRKPKLIKPGDTDIPSGVPGINLRSIYVP